MPSVRTCSSDLIAFSTMSKFRACSVVVVGAGMMPGSCERGTVEEAWSVSSGVNTRVRWQHARRRRLSAARCGTAACLEGSTVCTGRAAHLPDQFLVHEHKQCRVAVADGPDGVVQPSIE